MCVGRVDARFGQMIPWILHDSNVYEEVSGLSVPASNRNWNCDQGRTIRESVRERASPSRRQAGRYPWMHLWWLLMYACMLEAAAWSNCFLLVLRNPSRHGNITSAFIIIHIPPTHEPHKWITCWLTSGRIDLRTHHVNEWLVESITSVHAYPLSNLIDS